MSNKQQYFEDGSPIFPHRKSTELSESELIGLLSVDDLRNHPLFKAAVAEELKERELRECRSNARLDLELRAIDLQTMADR